MTNAIIPSRITEAREARAMSMEDLANSIGVTRQAVSKYEKGIIGPSSEMIQTISCVLSFRLSFFTKPKQKVQPGVAPYFFVLIQI